MERRPRRHALIGTVAFPRNGVTGCKEVQFPERVGRDHRRIGAPGDEKAGVEIGRDGRVLLCARRTPVALDDRTGQIHMILDRYLDNEPMHLLRQSGRSEAHTSELQYLMGNSYTVFYLKKNNTVI